jgi:hypothetical membrane protein
MDDDDGFRATPPARDNLLLSLASFASVARFAREHVALVATVVGALVFALRCVVVTDGNPYTASILVAQTSLGDAVRALLFSLFWPLLIVGSLNLAMTTVLRRDALERRAVLALLAGSLIMYLLGIYLSGASPRWLYAGLYFLSIGAMFLTSRNPRRAEAPGVGIVQMMAFLLATSGLLLVVVIVTDRSFWLPRERLVFNNEAPFTGYVIKQNSNYLVIMKDDPRVIIEKPEKELAERNICYQVIRDYNPIPKEARGEVPVCP